MNQRATATFERRASSALNILRSVSGDTKVDLWVLEDPKAILPKSKKITYRPGDLLTDEQVDQIQIAAGTSYNITIKSV